MPDGMAIMKYLTCGQMAHMNCITEKTLRFYQKKDILPPHHIDESTGFRYYDIMQATKLDMISHLQTMGFSLDEIKEIDGSKSIENLKDRANEQLAVIQEQQRQLAIAHQIASDLINDCNTFLDQPIFNQIVFEALPDRHMLTFDIPQADELDEESELNDSERWEWIVHYVKREIVSREWPLSLFRNVSYIVDKDKLTDPSAWKYRAFVLVDESFGSCFECAQLLPGGRHLTFYIDRGYADDGMAVDDRRFERMFDYAEKKRLEINGNPFCEAICRYQRFFNKSLDSFSRYCLPIKRRLP